MEKRYAKNPAPEDVDKVIDNPEELVVQTNPSKTSKNMGKSQSKRKRDSKGRFMSKSRKNQTEEFIETGQNLFMEYGLAALAATGTVKGAQFVVSRLPIDLPQMAREWLMILGPGAAGILVSMNAPRRSAIWQGVAGGMVLASANGLSDKLIEGSGLADADIGPQDLILKADGYLYDQDGNRIAKANMGGQSQRSISGQSGIANDSVVERSGGLSDGGSPMLLNDAGGYNSSFEQGENFNA